MQNFTAVDIKPMGEFDTQFGQAYFGQVAEEDNPVRFNLMNPVNVEEGVTITAETVERRQSKASGKPYWQLKKVKVLRGEPEAELVAETPEPKSLGESWSEVAAKTVGKGEIIEVPEGTAIITSPTDDVPSYEAGTNARWALKLSTDTYSKVVGGMPDGDPDWNAIEDMAKWLLGAFDRLKQFKGDD